MEESVFELQNRIADLEHTLEAVTAERNGLKTAILEHYSQKADDRCIEDDDRLYAAAGLMACDRRVGDKAAMLQNCQRFIERRCEGGHWPSYVDLEETVRKLQAAQAEQAAEIEQLKTQLAAAEWAHKTAVRETQAQVLRAGRAERERDECERQYQAKVAEVIGLLNERDELRQQIAAAAEE